VEDGSSGSMLLLPSSEWQRLIFIQRLKCVMEGSWRRFLQRFQCVELFFGGGKRISFRSQRSSPFQLGSKLQRSARMFV
jgi:hypothetical protein